MDRFIQIAIFQHVKDRREGFALDHFYLFSHLDKRRPYIKRFVCGLINKNTFAAGYRTAVALCLLKGTLHGGKRIRIDQRADERARLARISNDN